MTNRWMVGVDGTPGSGAALDWALMHAPARDADVTALHAYLRPVASRVLHGVAHRDAESSSAADLARHGLEAAVSVVDQAGDVDRLVVEGSPGKALVVAAADVDLLVVGRHGAETSWQRALGSVSRHCAIHAPVPTVVVPTDWDHRPTERILVGFDGSAHATAALHWALHFADAATPVTALVALEVAPWLRSDIIEDRLGEELAAEQERLTALLDTADPDRRARREIVVRGARPALSRASADTDLVVLGAHGAGRVATTFLGSVSTWMLDASAQPVVIVPDAG